MAAEADVKEFFKRVFKTPMFLVFLLISAFYALPSLGLQAEINRYAIVTAVGIDRVEDESENSFEVSLLTFIPIADQTFKETYKVISAQGRSISEAIDFAGLHIGREIGLSHVKLVVLNEELLSEDVSNFLDYLSRSETIAPSTKLIATNATAKEFLNEAEKLDSQSSIKVSDLIIFNDDYVYATDSSFENFYSGRLGPTKVSLMPFIRLDSDDSKGIQVIADQQPKAKNMQSTSSQGEGEKEISNNGDTIVLKNAQKKIVLDGRDIKKINFVKGSFRTGSIEIYDVEDEKFKNADLTFEILDKKIKYKVSFKNGYPIIYIDNTISLTLSEVKSNGQVVEDNVEYFKFSDEIKKEIEKKIRSSMMDAIEIMRENQVDIVDFYTLMYNSNKKAFLKFLDSLQDPEDYLNHVIFKAGIKIVTK